VKKLLIITGPQGSGNHIFSRLLSLHPDVAGWEEMLTQYWVPSDQEPFAEYWVDPGKLTADVFEGKDYHLANVSCPFFFNGERKIPDILGVAERAASFGVEVEIAIIVRDQNINRVQQERVRGMHTTPIAQEYYYKTLIPSGFMVHFLDHEAFFLHKEHYLKWVSTITGFPIAYDSPDLMKFFAEDANHKYVTPIESHWLDEVILKGCQPTRDERLKSAK
jgi:hypothetical protein